MKKKRAIRSLSANISNLVDGESQQNAFEKPVTNTADDNQSLTDIADVMEFARQVLREKESKINATRAGFLSDTEANKIRYKLQLSNRETPQSKRLSFLNELRCGDAKRSSNGCSSLKVQVHVPSHRDKFVHSRPPRSSTVDRKTMSPTKESTPIPLSPLEEKMQSQDDDKSASIDTLLKAIAVEAKETSDRIAATLTNYNVSENCESAAVKESDNLKTGENIRNDECADVNIKLSDLDESSDHAKMCKKLLECVAGSTPEANQPNSENNTQPSIADDVKQSDLTEDGKPCAEKSSVSSDSEHDYENISENENNNSSLVLNNRESKSDMQQDAHNNKEVPISPDLVKVSDESVEVDKDSNLNTLGDSESKSADREDEKGEKCVGVLSHAALSDNIRECAFLTENCCMGASNQIISFQSFNSSDLESFGLENREACIRNVTNSCCVVPKREEFRCFAKCDEDKSRLRNVRDSRHSLNNKLQPIRSWYYDPVIVAIACIYGLACIHQLASMNLIFVVSIVLAVFAVIVSLVL